MEKLTLGDHRVVIKISWLLDFASAPGSSACLGFMELLGLGIDSVDIHGELEIFNVDELLEFARLAN